ncbi:MAG: TVP38/TMEM64 family protein [Pseudomonadota bacterium]
MRIDSRQRWGRPLLYLALVLALLSALYWLLVVTGGLALLRDEARLGEVIIKFGAWGPLILITAMALAIVINPVPSAPIALAAGALYGHTWGTVYVVIGAEIGALVAFALARVLGYKVLSRLLGVHMTKGWLGSQNALMGMVFVSRLLPFVSFDLVSYAAGLTRLKPWRFAIATLAGIIPASFLLAHLGGELTTETPSQTMTTILLLGALTLLPFLFGLLRSANHKHPFVSDEDDPP